MGPNCLQLVASVYIAKKMDNEPPYLFGSLHSARWLPLYVQGELCWSEKAWSNLSGMVCVALKVMPFWSPVLHVLIFWGRILVKATFYGWVLLGHNWLSAKGWTRPCRAKRPLTGFLGSTQICVRTLLKSSFAQASSTLKSVVSSELPPLWLPWAHKPFIVSQPWFVEICILHEKYTSRQGESILTIRFEFRLV
jgi:hypothetical protein